MLHVDVFPTFVYDTCTSLLVWNKHIIFLPTLEKISLGDFCFHTMIFSSINFDLPIIAFSMLSSPLIFSVVRVAESIFSFLCSVSFLCFFFLFCVSFCHCIVFPSLIYSILLMTPLIS